MRFEDIRTKIEDIVRILVAYPSIVWGIVRYPNENIFPKIKRDPNIGLGLFLVLNIFSAVGVGQLLSYNIPGLPIEIPVSVPGLRWIEPLVDGLGGLVFRFILGISIFIFLLLKLSANRNAKFKSLVSHLFSVYAYSSVVFVPVVLIKATGSLLFANFLLEAMPLAFPGRPVDFDFVGAMGKISTTVLVYLVVISWWVWLQYIGLKKIRQLLRGHVFVSLLLTHVIFLTIQTASTLCWWYARYRPVFEAINIMEFELPKTLQAESPNYLKAAILSHRVGNSDLPPYYKYAGKLRSISYEMAALDLTDDGNVVTKEALQATSERNYALVEETLSRYLEERVGEEDNQMRLFFVKWQRVLGEAIELRSSKDFVDRSQQRENFYFQFPFSPVAILP